MITVEQLLMTAKEQGASDVHITVGVPPKMRVNGELLDLDYPRLMPDDCEKIVLSIMNERQLAMFKEKNITIRNYEDASFRITIGTKEENEMVLDVLRRFEYENS